MIKGLKSIRTWILLPLALQAFGRGMSIWPKSSNVSREQVPAPVVGANAPYIFSILWLTAALLILISILGGHSWKVFHPGPSVVSIRLEDIAVLMFICLTFTWSISYYIDFLHQVSIGNTSSTAGASGRNFFTWGMASFAVWYLLWSRKSREEVHKKIMKEIRESGSDVDLVKLEELDD